MDPVYAVTQLGKPQRYIANLYVPCTLDYYLEVERNEPLIYTTGLNLKSNTLSQRSQTERRAYREKTDQWLSEEGRVSDGKGV